MSSASTPALYTTSTLVDHVISIAQLDAADTRMRARYLREADEMLPDSPRGRRGRNAVPQIDAIHAVVMLFACLHRGPQLHAPEGVRELYSAPLYGVRPAGRAYELSDEGAFSGHLGGETFGAAVLCLVERSANGDSLNELQDILVYSHGSARIVCVSHTALFAVGGPAQAGDVVDTRISVVAQAHRALILELGAFVKRSRDAAAALGAAIDTSGMTHALRLSPPGGDFTWGPDRPRGARRGGEKNATPENETAASPGRDAAALIDRTTTTDPAGCLQHQPTSERDFSQPLSESRDGRSQQPVRGPTHDRRSRPHPAFEFAA